ncbi:MAG: WD40 repeat domain-containing protein [Phycisphaeraceae bacterium]
MAQDRYTQWLKLPVGERPPDHYTLLGLLHFCEDSERIEQASHERLERLDRYALSPDAASRADCQRMMNEVAQARVVLKDAGRRFAYDVELAAKLGVAPPQAVVMPAEDEFHIEPENESASEPMMEQVVAPVVKAPQRPAPAAPPAPPRSSPPSRPSPVPVRVTPALPRSPKEKMLISGAALAMIAVAALVIMFITNERDPSSPADPDTPYPANPGLKSDPGAALTSSSALAGPMVEQARSLCIARLQECRNEKPIMELIDEYGQRDWRIIMSAIEEAEVADAAPAHRVKQYEKAFDKLGEVMTHARRSVEIIRSTRGPYDEAAAHFDPDSFRLYLPSEYVAVQRSVKSATIAALNHRPDQAKQHFEQAAKLYREATTEARVKDLPGVSRANEPPALAAGPHRMTPMSEPFKGPYHVRYVQFSPDGRLLGAGGERELLLWDVAAGKPHETKSLLPEPAGIIYFSFTLDGTALQHYTREGISTWDLANLRNPPSKGRRWEVGGPLVMGGPYASILMSGRKDIEIWDRATGQPVSTLKHDSAVSYHAVSDDGAIAISLEHGKSDIHVWNPKPGEKLATRHNPFAGELSGTISLRQALSPDGRIVACGNRQTVRFAATGDAVGAYKPLNCPGNGKIERLQFSPDGRRLLIGLHDRSLEPPMQHSLLIYDPIEGRLIGPPLPSGDDGLGRFPTPTWRCSPDGKLLGIGGATGVLRVVRLDTGEAIADDLNIGSTIWDINFSQNREMLAVLYVDALVRIYRLVPAAKPAQQP